MNWKITFIILLFLSVALFTFLYYHYPDTQLQIQTPACYANQTNGCNPDCTGYVVDGIRYCNQISYHDYQYTISLIDNLQN